MKVFVDISHFAAGASLPMLRERIAHLEDVGATGVSVSDHLFEGTGPSTCDPLTTLAAVASLSNYLEVQTLVLNSDWLHPGLLLRQFAQLAFLIGGGRVTAGLGAGWNAEEFEAMGMKMGTYKERIDRLEETLQIARQVFLAGVATLDGKHVSARDLTISPKPAVPPYLLIGGGSDRVLEIVGRYADILDLHGSSTHAESSGRTPAERRIQRDRGLALTTVDDRVIQVERMRAASRAAGRSIDAVGISVQIEYVAFGGTSEVSRAEEQICHSWGHMATRSLAENPYVLLGEPRQIADTLARRRELFGLERIVLKEQTDPLNFCRRVLPWC